MNKKYTDVNRESVNRWVSSGWEWGTPITHQQYIDARNGKWDVLLTPVTPVPHSWFGNPTGKKVLGLASGGGQQMPIFNAIGADCTVFDLSDRMLEAENLVASREGYSIRAIQGDMTEPLPFEDEEFDLIFNPVSNCYIQDLMPVFRECFRILKKGGILMVGFDNGLGYAFNDEQTALIHKLPFNPLEDPALMKELEDEDGGIQFSHTLKEEIGGQIEAGLVIQDIFEDTIHYGLLEKFNVPTFCATLARKN
ncbi:MAG: class I SAM-dependent methyltransferase [Sphaerochaetaceae bacterium]|jgi:SAM-dependent methyltransferase